MIRKLLEDHIRKNVTDDKVAVLLSGGVDSISVGLAAHHAGKEVHAYSFQLGNQTSYDFAKAAEVAYKMKWEFTPVVVPKENLIPDWHRLVKLGCRKKTHFETVFPFLYVYPEIEETYVVTGWGADGYFGVSKKAMMRYSSMQKGRNYVTYCKEHNQKRLNFNQFREAYFAEGQCAGLDWHNKLVVEHNKKHITPYLDEDVRDYLMSKTYRELNTPKQKSIVRRDFTEFKKFGRIETHINLHLGAGVDKLFETLLNSDEINIKNRTRMMDVSRDWSHGILPI
jgi:asparagine synthetase B (glutamine-hydrolysing)